ncbi:unnamed protein product, partial [Heterotrigona itama]
ILPDSHQRIDISRERLTENFVGRRNNKEYELSEKDFTVASES